MDIDECGGSVHLPLNASKVLSHDYIDIQQL